MSGNKKNLVVGVLLLLLLIFGCMGFAKLAEIGSEGKAPIRGLRIVIDVDERDQLFDQLQEFAQKHGFTLFIREVEVIPEGIFIEMYRSDLEISAVSVPDAPTKIDLNFYETETARPPNEDVVDKLFEDLKSVISEIPNVLLTEKRKALTITLDKSQREELFTQLRKLADTYSLEFTLSFSSDKTLFQAEIYGDGFHIKSDPVVGSPRTVVVEFYVDYHKVPTPASLEAVDEIFDELKNLLGEIQDVTIIEEK